MKGGAPEKMAVSFLAVGGVCLGAAVFRLLYCEARFRGRGVWVDRLHLGDEATAARLVEALHALCVLAQAGLGPALETAGGRLLAQTLTLGFLAHDAQLRFRCPDLWSRTKLLHHLAFAALLGGCLAFDTEAARAGLLSEAAVPFINLGWALHVSGAGARSWEVMLFRRGNSIVTALIFGVARLASFPFLAGHAWKAGFPVIAAAALLLAILDSVWYLGFVWHESR